MRRLQGAWKGAALIALTAVLTLCLLIAGYLWIVGEAWMMLMGEEFSVSEFSQGLVRSDAGYVMQTPLPDGDWFAMLIGGDGAILWSHNLPQTLNRTYSLCDVASFSRWYLADHPIFTWTREDGLLAVGAPKGSYWRNNMYMRMELTTLLIARVPIVLSIIFLLVLGVTALMTRRWMRREQRRRDEARAQWIAGISHDIRTPLSLVLGYADEIGAQAGNTARSRALAGIICRQSEVIRDLVIDLNMTMRLDSDMQPVRAQRMAVEPLMRACAADFLNSGMAEGYPFEMALPDEPLWPIVADAGLLRRAVMNLLHNCVRHNPPATPITMGARQMRGSVVIFVESGAAGRMSAEAGTQEDGLAPHGTGLRLVRKIAQAHGGRARFDTKGRFLCEIELPAHLVKRNTRACF